MQTITGETKKSGETVSLSPTEEREAEKRAGLRAAVVFESVRREGEKELKRPPLALAFSALAAGLSMGLSMIASGLLAAVIPEAPWRPAIVSLGYTLGFMVVILARQQLFTENTVTAIIPLLDDRNKPQKLFLVARMWAIVLAANLAGAFLIALLVDHSGAFTQGARDAFVSLGLASLAPSFGTVFIKGVFAGWIIALMVWLLPASQGSRVSVILLLTYVVGLGQLSHVVAGSVEAMYATISGASNWPHYFGGFLLPAFLGNSLGGVLFVSLLNYGQVAAENDDEA